MDISPLITSRACLNPGFLIRRIQLKKIFPSVIHCDCNYGVGRTSLWINEGLEKRVGSYGVSRAGGRFLVYNARKLPRVHVFAVILLTRPVKILPVTPYCRETFRVRMKSSSRRRRHSRRRCCRRRLSPESSAIGYEFRQFKLKRTSPGMRNYELDRDADREPWKHFNVKLQVPSSGRHTPLYAMA